VARDLGIITLRLVADLLDIGTDIDAAGDGNQREIRRMREVESDEPAELGRQGVPEGPSTKRSAPGSASTYRANTSRSAACAITKRRRWRCCHTRAEWSHA
jgi:hypothetical protein